MVFDVNEYSRTKLTVYGNKILDEIKRKGKLNKKFKTFSYPGVGVCVKLKNANMNCYRANHPGESIKNRRVFTKSSDCKAVLGLEF